MVREAEWEIQERIGKFDYFYSDTTYGEECETKYEEKCELGMRTREMHSEHREGPFWHTSTIFQSTKTSARPSTRNSARPSTNSSARYKLTYVFQCN